MVCGPESVHDTVTVTVLIPQLGVSFPEITQLRVYGPRGVPSALSGLRGSG